MSTSSQDESVTSWVTAVRSKLERAPIWRFGQALASVVGDETCVVIDWAEDWSQFDRGSVDR
jgi:hypothetical protein